MGCDVRPPSQVARSETLALTVSSSAVQLAAGETAQLQVSPVDGAGLPFTGVLSVGWSSSNASVASISSSGLVTAVSAGAATVTARATRLDTGAVATATVQLSVATTTDVEPPTAPTALTGTATSSTQVSLNWAASTDNVGVVGYQVFRNGSLVSTPSQTTWQDTGLTASTAYDYAVAAVDGAGLLSPRSGTVRVTTLAAPGPVNGLVGAWGLNETAGTTVGDLSGNGHTGTMAAAQWAAGKHAGGLLFSGSGQVLLNDINALDGLGAMTVSAWMKTTATGEKHAVDKSRCDGTGVFEFGTSFFTQGRASFLVYQPGGSYTFVESAQNVTDGQWHFVAGTFDGTMLRVFVDGVASSGAPSAAPFRLASTSDQLEFGGRCNGNPYFWNGSLDDVRLYDRALSAAEVVNDSNTPLIGVALGAGGGATGGGAPVGGGTGAGGGAGFYTTSFAANEEPISEGGAWKHLAPAWQVVRTTGGHAGPNVNSAGGAVSGPPFDDSYAHLTGFAANQQVDVTIYQGVASAGEVEILLRVNDSPTSVQCYELLYNIQGSAEIVRWNGPLNDFEENPAGTVVYPSPPGAISGDKLRGRVVGSVVEFWFIASTGPQAGVPHLLATLDDQSSRRVNAGQPGMAFFQRSNSGEPAGSLDFGFADYTAQALP